MAVFTGPVFNALSPSSPLRDLHFPGDPRQSKLGASLGTRLLWGCESGRVCTCFCKTQSLLASFLSPNGAAPGRGWLSHTHSAAVAVEAQSGRPGSLTREEWSLLVSGALSGPPCQTVAAHPCRLWPRGALGRQGGPLESA